MRHRKKKYQHLKRETGHRKALMANLANALILNKRIKTTTPKAKALRQYVEPIITKSKTDSTHSRREVFRRLEDKYAVNELFREVSEKVADRPGGYTRILKIGNREGDNADMSIIELVDYNENMQSPSKTQKTSRRTRRAGRRRKSSSSQTASQAEESQESQTEEADSQEVSSESTEAAEGKKAESDNQTGSESSSDDQQEGNDQGNTEQQKND